MWASDTVYFILDYKQIKQWASNSLFYSLAMWASDTVYFILDYKQITPSHVSEWHSLFYSGL